MIIGWVTDLAQQASADAGPNWLRAIAILGALALVLVFCEAVVWLIHHWPHAPRDPQGVDDRDGPGPP